MITLQKVLQTLGVLSLIALSAAWQAGNFPPGSSSLIVTAITVGSGGSITPTGTGTIVATNGVTRSGASIDLSDPPYSLKTALWVGDATSTNTSQTVTCPNSDCNFVASAVGQKVYGICPTGLAKCPPVGTILSLNNANSIQVSNAATVSTVAQGVLVWGPDSTAALTAATTAAWALCAGTSSVTVNFPVGFFLTSLPQFNNSTAACKAAMGGGNGSVGETGAITFKGQGKFASNIVPTPDFTFTAAAAQFFSASGGSATLNLMDMGINGMGWSCGAQATGNAVGWLTGNNAYVKSGGFLNWCTQPTDTFVGVLAQGPGILIIDTQIDGFGKTGLQSSGTCCNNIYGGWIDNEPVALVNNSTLFTHNMQIGEGSSSNVISFATGALWVSDGDNILGNAGSTCIDARIAGVTIILKNDYLQCNSTAGSYAILQNNTSTVIMQNTNVLGGATNGWLNNTSPAVFIDEGGNTETGALLVTGSYRVVGPQVFSGKGTGVCTSSVTVFLFPIGQNTARTCTVVTETQLTGAGIVTSPGTLHNLICTASAAGSTVGSGAMTVRLNGVNTAITATFGTTTSAIDGTHTQAVVVGDEITIQGVMGLAETLANPACQVQVN